MSKRTVLLVIVALLVGCGGDDDEAAERSAATTAAAVEDEAQLALSVRVPQYLDDIKSGAKEGGRERATDKLIDLMREHREALGDDVVAKTLRDGAAYARQYCPVCADELEAEAESVAAGAGPY